MRFELPKTPELSEQTVLITGAANGLGRALAKAFDQAGATLALVDVNEQGLRETASKLAKANSYLADLSDAAATKRVLEEIRAQHTTVHTLIHNAGFLVPQSFDEMPEERWNLTFNVGMQAAYLLTRAFWADWLKNGGAGIYVSSRSGIQGFAGETPYCATKHAIEGFVKALGMECTGNGIFVHSITPGMYMHTAMSEQNYPPELKAKWVDPIELAPAFLYLARRMDASLSGQRIDAWALSQQLKAGGAAVG
jgi:NAD(P)-dependent dehydrogenase (short-subunit alcohol dehydrogenase family)